MRRVLSIKRSQLSMIFVVSCLLIVTGCDLNKPTVQPPQVVTVPVITLPPIISATAKYTATLPPSDTPSPTETLPPSDTPQAPTDVPTATLSPTPAIRGVINTNNPTANLRTGPGSNFPVVLSVKAGTSLTVLLSNSDKTWYSVRLDDGTEGWVAANLLTVSNEGVVAALSDADLTKRASDGVTPGDTPGPGPVATRIAGSSSVRFSDVLAYCDNKENGEKRKEFPTGTAVSIYWSWYAKTPEQLKDHIDNAIYDIRVDGKPLDNWQVYMTAVVRETIKGKGDRGYFVYWFYPIGTPATGEHKVDFKLSWKQKIFDGYKNYGPGGDQETDSGTCGFTVK